MNEHRIHGPPGTGKTTKVAAWVRKACARFGSSEVMVSSFTRAAAHELVSRDLPIDASQVGTLHALCFRALGRPEIAEGKLAEWNAACPHYALQGGKSNLDDPYASHGMSGEGDRLMHELSRLRARMTPEQVWSDGVRAFARRWSDWKEQCGYMDFTDLIEVGLHELTEAPGAPRVGFIDEAQDLSPLELALVRKWSAEMEYVVLVGDADQSIYRFRGASPRSFLEPEIAADQNTVLGQSWRVPRAPHALAKSWIERCTYRYPSEYLPKDADGLVREFPASFQYPEDVVAQIESLEGESMVLATCSYMLHQVVRVLKRRGVPFHNPYRAVNGAWNPLRGGAARLASYLRPCRETYGSNARWWNYRELWSWAQMLRARGTFRVGMKSVLEQMAKDEAGAVHERTSAASIDQFSAFFEPAFFDRLRSAVGDTADDACRFLQEALLSSKRSFFEYAFTVCEINGSRALIQEPRVIVGTVHSVKGAQTDNVFLFPDLSPSGMLEWIGSDEERDSIRRVFYVGATRTKHGLYLCSPSGDKAIDWRL